jgi:hypothetical protein
MLHAVPELLDALEARLMHGEDPSQLLAGIRWTELVGWPSDVHGARALKHRITSLQNLLAGLQAPLRATLLNLSGSASYGRNGVPAEGPMIPAQLREKV